MMTRKFNLFLALLGVLVTSGAMAQTPARTVMVQSNNALLLYPTNFWSANAAQARAGLGLGSAATNPASAFQPSSATLSNLAAGVVAATNITGVLSVSSGGTAATNAAAARSNLGLGSAATNPATAFQPSSLNLSNLSTNNGGSLTNLTAANIIGTVGLASNVSGVVAITNGGSGATTAGGARTNFGLPLAALTNANATNFRAAIGLGATNDVTINSLAVSNAGLTRTNLSLGLAALTNTNSSTFRSAVDLGWSALTNTNSSTFRGAIDLGWSALTNTNAGTGLVSVNTNGEVVSPTNFWQVAPASTTVQNQTSILANSTNNATNSRNLVLYSLSPVVSGVTNTVQLPTNPATTFEGDRVTITHLGQTNTTVTAIRQSGAGTNLITINRLGETIALIYRNGAWGLANNISYIEPIYFSGTNAAANAAASVSNLFIPNTPLVFTTNGQIVANTGTNVLTFTNEVKFGSGALTVSAQNISGSGVDLSFEDGAYGGTLYMDGGSIEFSGATNAATTRTNLGLGLPALTNTSNVTMMRALAGSTNTNAPFSGSVSVVGTNNTNTLVFTNGILREVTTP